MKTKDVIALGLLAVMLVVMGSFLVSKLGRGGQPRRAQVEVVLPIDANFNEEARSILLGNDQRNKASNFSAPANLGSGFGNNRPFGT